MVHVSLCWEINIKAGFKWYPWVTWRKERKARSLGYLHISGILIEEISPAEDEFIIKNNTQENSFSSQMRADITGL